MHQAPVHVAGNLLKIKLPMGLRVRQLLVEFDAKLNSLEVAGLDGLRKGRIVFVIYLVHITVLHQSDC